MTFAEKAKKDNPNIEMSNGRPIGCPYRYGYEKEYDCGGIACFECWNREMPSEDKPFTKEEVYKESGYNKGLNDAWELVKKCWHMEPSKTKEIFGYEYVTNILEEFTPQEALAKLKAYEEAQEITRGDEVICLDTDEKAIFIGKSEGSQIGWFLLKEYDVPQQIMMNEVKKTGKHIDISSILEQIGE